MPIVTQLSQSTLDLISFQTVNHSALVDEESLDSCIWLTEDQVDEMLEDQREAAMNRGSVAGEEAPTKSHGERRHRQKRKIEDFERSPQRKWTVMPIRYKFDGAHSMFARLFAFNSLLNCLDSNPIKQLDKLHYTFI